MNDFFQFINQNNSFKNSKRKTLKLIFGDVNYEITFEKYFHDSERKKLNKFKIKKIFLFKYQENNGNIFELYRLLNLFFKYLGEIPKYSYHSINDQIGFTIEIEEIQELFFYEFLNMLENNKIQFKSSSDKLLYINYTSFEENKINILQTNTKTRRIGYLKMIMKFFEKSSYFPKTYLSKKVETESLFYEKQLLEYGNNLGDSKGIIKKTANGVSAKPYVILLEECNLITQINNSYILTKQSKIFFYLSSHLKNKNEVNNNLFELNLLDKIFFFRHIFISDSLYLWSILDILFIAHKPLSTMSIKKHFVNYIKNELENNLKYSKSNITKRKIVELKKRISAWKKPLVYLEHIIEPRVNWLVDLGILKIDFVTNEKRYYFTEIGNRLIYVLSTIYEKNLNKQLILQSFFRLNYFKIFNFIYNHNKTIVKLNELDIQQYLFEAFKIFKTSAPNRIAASQGIDYICFKFFIEQNAIIEFEDLKNYLQKHNSRFSMDWFKTENDGAIYLKK